MGLWEPYAHHRVTEPVGSQTASSKAVLWPMFTSYFTRRGTLRDDLRALQKHEKDVIFKSCARESTTRFVRPLVGQSVGRSRFTFFEDFMSLTSLLLPKWSSALI